VLKEQKLEAMIVRPREASKDMWEVADWLQWVRFALKLAIGLYNIIIMLHEPMCVITKAKPTS
jgi:hypothetical protein